MKNRTSISQNMVADLERRSAITALVLVDDRPLRTTASKEFQKLYKRYNQYLSELQNHEAKVRPAYYGWMLGLFGEKLKRLRDLQMELVKKSSLLHRMRELCIFEGLSRTSAFEFAHEELEAEETAQFEESAFDDDSADETWDSDNQHHEDDKAKGRRWSENAADDLLEALSNMAARLTDEEQDLEAEVKKYYRKLAQALHPDLVGAPTEYSGELWRETQEAYEKRDLEQLKLLWTLLTLQTDTLSRDVRLFELKTAVSHMEKKLREVKKEKRRLSREDPSWGFDKKNHTSLAAEIRADLAKEIGTLSGALADVEDDLKVFAHKPKRGARPFSEREDISFDY